MSSADAEGTQQYSIPSTYTISHAYLLNVWRVSASAQSWKQSKAHKCKMACVIVIISAIDNTAREGFVESVNRLISYTVKGRAI